MERLSHIQCCAVLTGSYLMAHIFSSFDNLIKIVSATFLHHKNYSFFPFALLTILWKVTLELGTIFSYIRLSISTIILLRSHKFYYCYDDHLPVPLLILRFNLSQMSGGMPSHWLVHPSDIPIILQAIHCCLKGEIRKDVILPSHEINHFSRNLSLLTGNY